ncbi:MAG: hypothetical protein HYZ26_03505 [Chloroflexi bacterium]|nr:hypothetical protein [Chloroflexota bacterium]
MTNGLQTLVTCFSGHTYAQRPRSVQWQGGWQDILTVLADWHTPEGRAFRVLTAAGAALELRYLAERDAWEAAAVT